MLTRQQLEILNRKTLRYPLEIAEKDYMLALVLQLLSSSPIGEKLVFKGGNLPAPLLPGATKIFRRFGFFNSTTIHFFRRSEKYF